MGKGVGLRRTKRIDYILLIATLVIVILPLLFVFTDRLNGVIEPFFTGSVHFVTQLFP